VDSDDIFDQAECNNITLDSNTKRFVESFTYAANVQLTAAKADLKVFARSKSKRMINTSDVFMYTAPGTLNSNSSCFSIG